MVYMKLKLLPGMTLKCALQAIYLSAVSALVVAFLTLTDQRAAIGQSRARGINLLINILFLPLE